MCIKRHLIGAMTTPPEPVPIARLVDGDPIDPGPESGLPAETGNRAEDLEEHFLREIKRLVTVAKQVERQLHDHPLVAVHQLRECQLIAACAALNQRRFVPSDSRPVDDPCLLHEGHGTQHRPRFALKVPVWR